MFVATCNLLLLIASRWRPSLLRLLLLLVLASLAGLVAQLLALLLYHYPHHLDQVVDLQSTHVKQLGHEEHGCWRREW